MAELKRILITGATGLLGGMCLWRWRRIGLEITALVRRPDELPENNWPGVETISGDLANPKSLTDAVEAVRPELVVHCAALTNVDKCQKEPEACKALNTAASGVLAAAAKKLGAAMVHISTDAVYAAGPGPHDEADAGGELSVYAASKLSGEKAVAEAHPGALILRTCMIGWNQNPARSSLAEWIVATLQGGKEVPGFIDVRFSPLFTGTLADIMLKAAYSGLSGVYNLGSRDGLSKFEAASLIAKGLGADHGRVRPTSQKKSKLSIPRPEDPVLNSQRIYTALDLKAPLLSTEISDMLRMESSGELTRFRRFGGYA
jgi:dTDP-4-dehydrorhamnose reductase